MNREEGWELLCEYTQTEALRRHAVSVETVMQAEARQHGGDENTWGLVGLLHDFDYEMFPDEHPMKGRTILEERGVPDEIVYAIQCHADFTGYERRSKMDQMNLRGGRADGIRHRLHAGASDEEPVGAGREERAQEAEGQELRAQRDPGRHLERRSAARGRFRRARRLRHRGAETRRGRDRPQPLALTIRAGTT